jgi:hypothetical protein
MERELARRDALRLALDRMQYFEQRFERGISEVNLAASDAGVLQRLIHSPKAPDYLPLANRHIRLLAIDALICELHDSFARCAPDFHLLTLIWDEGATWEHEPNVDVPMMVRKVQDALQRVGIEAFCTVEMEACSRRELNEPSRRLSFHVHGTCWTRGGRFQIREKERLLADLDGGAAFYNTSGARPAVFTHQPATWSSIAGLGEYLFKANDRLKKRVWRDVRGRYRQLDAPRGEYSPCLAVRFMELCSRLTLDDVAFGAGAGGIDLWQRWRNRVEQRTAKCAVSVDIQEVEEIWSRAYRRATSGPIGSYKLSVLGVQHNGETPGQCSADCPSPNS